MHSYDAQLDGQTDAVFRDGTQSRHWSLQGCVLDRNVVSARTTLTAAYRLESAGTAVGGDTAPFEAGNTSFELWIRPGALDSNHQVIFETGGGQNGSSFHITDSTIRFLNSRLNTRNFDLSVSLAELDLSDFLHLVASLEETNGRIVIYVTDSSGNQVTTQALGPVGRGGNRASLFSWGSNLASLGGNHNNLGGRTELAGVTPTGLTQFRGQIARLRVHNVALSPEEVRAAFDEVAGSLPSIQSFDADPGSIASGESATLTWSVSDATQVSIRPNPGDVTAETIDGTGSTTVTPDTTTVYTLEIGNGRVTRRESVQVIVDGQVLPPRISEFLADNDNALEDGFGSSPDWIEIENPGLEPINLRSFYLTDTPDNLTRWRFPDAEIEGGGFLLVFASGRSPDADLEDGRDPAGFLHANFQLRSSGELLALVAPGGQTVISEFSPVFPAQREDISYGVQDGEIGYFPVPTPGAPNSGIVEGLTSDTTFSVDRGLFDAPFSVEITATTPDAQIRYTTDGSAPSSERGTLYSDPVEITTTTTLRAIAYRENYAPSNIDTQTYIFLEDVIGQPNNPAGFPRTWAGVPADYEMDPDVIGPENVFQDRYRETIIDDLKSLPVLSLVLEQSDLFGPTGIYENPAGDGVAWERPASVELLYPDDPERGFQQNCAVRIQGGSSRSTNYPKHSFRLLFKRDYGPGKLRYPLFEGQP
ncbi:MAG: FN3 associated domain-containing protein, partial [Planctomycetota bacterium]